MSENKCKHIFKYRKKTCQNNQSLNILLDRLVILNIIRVHSNIYHLTHEGRKIYYIIRVLEDTLKNSKENNNLMNNKLIEFLLIDVLEVLNEDIIYKIS